MTETANCPYCESEIPTTAQKCRHCGEWVSRDCQTCGTPVRGQWAARGQCAECESKTGTGFNLQTAHGRIPGPLYPGERKNRGISVALALIVGGFGAHKFYHDKPGKGLLYMMFCWTGIPSIIAIVEAVKYIRMDEEEFHQRSLSGGL